MTVLNIDCRAGLAMFPDGYFSSIVTDPPYELGFMGKSWDASGIAYDVAMWRECMRVLKPGGHLLAFSGSRTYHRMTCAIEDAGFEIRDQIMWVYGSGFPKSLDVSKAIDKTAGAERIRVLVPSKVGNSERRGEGKQGATFGDSHGGFTDVSEPVTDAARQWEGWGTALKPAHEPICVARKPLVGTVAANVQQHGTGGLNIDGCRVAVDRTADASQLRTMQRSQREAGDGWGMSTLSSDEPAVVRADGRWPANLIHDGSDEVLAAFPDAGGALVRVSGDEPSAASNGLVTSMRDRVASAPPRGDTGNAARFFYCAKASKRDRDEGLEGFTPATTSDGRAVAADNAYQRGKTERANIHPTVKPTDLMRYLCRLVTPPGGAVLDPFAGSGSTGKAAALERFEFFGFELSEEYAAIAQARINAARASL